MNKAEAYTEVINIGESKGIDVKEYILDLATHKEVSERVLDFISSSHKETCSVFIENVKKKPLYKEFSKDSLSALDKAKAVSSFITHALIERTLDENFDQDSSINFGMILDDLKAYMVNDDTTALDETVDYIKCILT